MAKDDATIFVSLGGIPCRQPSRLILFCDDNGYDYGYWYRRANSFCTQVGKDSGVGWFLLSRSNYLSLNKTSPVTATFSYDNKTVTLNNLYVVSQQSVFAHKTQSNDGSVLVKCVDPRFLFKNTSIVKSYNVRSPAPIETTYTPADENQAAIYQADSLNAGAVWTWQTLLNDIWALLPAALAGTAPTLPYTPAINYPQNIRFIGISAWEAYYAVLKKLQLDIRFVYSGASPSFVIFSQGDAYSVDSNLASADAYLVGNTYGDNIPGVSFPATIRVLFRKVEEYFGCADDSSVTTPNIESVPAYYKDTATGISGAIAGTIQNVWDDFPARYDVTGTIVASSQAECDARAAEIAAKLIAVCNESNQVTCRRYYGFQTAGALGSGLNKIIYSDYGEGCYTTYLTSALTAQTEDDAANFYLEKYNTGLGNNSASQASITPKEILDLGTTWPGPVRTDKLVIIGDGTESGPPAVGSSTAMAFEGYWRGKVLRYDPTQLASASAAYTQTKEKCWIAVVNTSSDGSRDAAARLKYGDVYLARFYGYKLVNSEIRPVYVIRNVTSAINLIRCKVYDDQINTNSTGSVEPWDQTSGNYLTGASRINISTDGIQPLFKNQIIHVIYDTDEAEYHVVEIENHIMKGKAIGNISKGGLGAVQRYDSTDTAIALPATINVKSKTFNIKTGGWVLFAWIEGEWVIVESEPSCDNNITVVTSLSFNATTCVLTYCTRNICLPDGATISDVDCTDKTASSSTMRSTNITALKPNAGNNQVAGMQQPVFANVIGRGGDRQLG